MSKCRYDLSEDCNNSDCILCVLDKVRAEIEQVALKDVNGSKYIFVDRVNQIFDKYKAESEGLTETWNGYHRQVTAPAGTFERIFNEADNDNDNDI